MAAYLTSADLHARIKASVQLMALDDDADCIADAGVLDSILAAASRWVDGLLRRTAELDSPYPAIAVQAAISRAVWMVYERAGKTGKDNPLFDEMTRFEKILADVAAGKGDIASAGAAESSVKDPLQDTDDPSEFYHPTGI
jgi:hypothetical protein